MNWLQARWPEQNSTTSSCGLWITQFVVTSKVNFWETIENVFRLQPRQQMEFNQNRIHRVFQLIKLLKSRPLRTKEQLAESVGCTVRSIYRYFHLLEDLGFKVRTNSSGQVYIASEERPAGLTARESEFIAQILSTTAANHPMTGSIIRKVRGQDDDYTTSGQIAQANATRILEKCTDAMSERRQLVLLGYASAHSESVKDRLVEPVNFTDNYRSLGAYEVETGAMKLFKLDRVTDAFVSDKAFSYEAHHVPMHADCFGFAFRSDMPARSVHCRLSLRAGLVLKDEYPDTLVHLVPLPDAAGYEFKAPVADFRAPKRFIQGWGPEVEVLGDEDFLDFMEAKPPRPPAYPDEANA